MKLVVLNCMVVLLILQDVLLCKHVMVIKMNKHVYMLKVIMGNVFIKINHVILFLVVTYLMVIHMKPV